MKKYILLTAIAVFSFILVFNVSAINITNCQELQNIKNSPTDSYELISNIDCSDTVNWNNGAGFIPIHGFRGSLEGNGHEISGLYIKREIASMFDGLCADTDSQVVIRDIKFTNFLLNITDGGDGGLLNPETGCFPSGPVIIDNITAIGSVYGGTHEYTGGLMGRVNRYVTIQNSHVEGYIQAAGGLAGQNDGHIINSSFNGVVDGTLTSNIDYAGPDCDYPSRIGCTIGMTGGMVGWNDGTIDSSYSEGQVLGLNNVGGFVGAYEFATNWAPGNIYNSYTTSQVTGDQYVGGFAGYNVGGSLYNSFAAGEVSSGVDLLSVPVEEQGLMFAAYSLAQENAYSEEDIVGGFTSYLAEDFECPESFWDIDATGILHSVCAGGKSTLEMKNKSTFNTWDFNNTWTMPKCDYPRLSWENRPAVECNDEDGDGVLDENDKCPGTIGSTLSQGCSCEQILALKPGENTEENLYGCSAGTIAVFEKAIGWAKDLFLL